MAKQIEIPKINMVTFKYNGDQNSFEKFLSNMAFGYSARIYDLQSW